MKSKRQRCLLGLMCLIISTARVTAQTTPLDEYVYLADDNFSFRVVSSVSDFFTAGYVLELTSQAWRDSSEVDHVIWKHWVKVIIPSLGPLNDTALLFINGGSHLDPLPVIDPDYRLIAAATRSVIVELTAVPNQPLRFANESIQRSEDEIIAYSWDKFLRGGDDFWPVQLPMVKSAVRCMDAVQEFAASQTGTPNAVNSFVVTGGSKRGWAAWLTAAVDSRVAAVVPIVIDLLNMKRSFAHHWGAYGFWVETLKPYEDMHIFEQFDSPRIDDLLQCVDPYRYLNRLTMPKFIINAAGDDFFVMDSLQFYIDDLPGQTHVRCVPNADHYFTGTFQEVLNGTVPYYYDILNDNPHPRFSWTLPGDGSIRVQTIDTPGAVILWQAANPDARDFRLVTIGPAWQSSPLSDHGQGLYVADVPTPPQGWTAFFVELIYDNEFSQTYSPDGTYDYHFTTEIRVLPEECPFDTDFNRDRQTDLIDLAMFSDEWLGGNAYRDIMPRRGGDNIVNIRDFALFGQHWLISP